MLSKVNSSSVQGMEGMLISIETDISNGLPNFNIVGLADTGVKEAKDRIRASIINSGLSYPRTRITINMSPAGVRKRGSHFDLAIAVGILTASGQIEEDRVSRFCFIGELSLDGGLKRTDGILPMMMAVRNRGIRDFIVPEENEEEAALLKDVNVYVAGSLAEIGAFLNNIAELKRAKKKTQPKTEVIHRKIDFADVKGQEFAKRAITVAVAGGHGIFMMGSPSTGKTMLAERIPTIMPEMEYEEILETTVIYSISGLLNDDEPLIDSRPFRQPHHRITQAAFLGGGAYPKPGEISLASKGVLFLDELGEFDRGLIEALRVPLEKKYIILNRKGATYRFPCDLLLVAASNPCKCGYYGDPSRKCTCTLNEINRYRKKMSGPILERIDMNISLTPVSYEDYSKEQTLSSEEMKASIVRVREIQKERYIKEEICLNSQMDENLIKKYVDNASKEYNSFIKEAYESLNLNPRTMLKIKRIARTVADLNGEERVDISHLAEALRYREEKSWQE